jgi:hypothetical protein
MELSNSFPLIKFKHPVSILIPVSNESYVIEGVANEWLLDIINFLPKGSELLFDDGYSAIELEVSDIPKKYDI